MPRDTTPTVVIFRTDLGRHGAVVALFPELPADVLGRFCLCYQHLGQHSSADTTVVIAQTRPAKPNEYAELKRELESIGYELDIREKVTRELGDRRRAAARQVCAETSCVS